MLDKLNAILALFSVEQPEWSAVEVAQSLRMPRSTTYRLLSRIAEAGFLDLDAHAGRYRLGIKLASMGAVAQRSTTLQRAAHPVLQRLAAEAHETATLMVRGGWEGVTIDAAMSMQPLMVPGLLGTRMPLHASAGGKVLLAWMSDTERRTVVRSALAVHTQHTIIDPDALELELQRVRSLGYSTVRGEWAEGVYGAAAPIRSYSNAVVGAITMGGPRARVTDERLEALVQLVVHAAAQVSMAIGFSEDQRDKRREYATELTKAAG
jgi:DNA-binding IclR family transcriptional regulator